MECTLPRFRYVKFYYVWDRGINNLQWFWILRFIKEPSGFYLFDYLTHLLLKVLH